MSQITEDAKAGNYTAENMPDELRRFIIFLLANDWPERQIAERLHVHHRCVARVHDESQSEIGEERVRLVRRLRQAGRYQVDRLVEHPSSVPMQYAAKTARDLIEVAELLDGRATARVEHVEGPDIYSDWEKFIEKQLQPGDVREIASETGLPGEKKPAIESGESGSIGPATDSGSEHRAPAASEPDGDATAIDTEPRTESERLEEGGGGVQVEASPPKASTSKSPQKILSNSGPGGNT